MNPQGAVSTRADYGLARWMPRVLKERKKAAKGLGTDEIHDLRTALRRCLAIEDALSEFDPHPAWKRLRNASKKLLKGLGELRDAQVLLELLKKLDVARDKTGGQLCKSIEDELGEAKKDADAALKKFSPQKWKGWQAELEPRANSFLPDSLELQYVALERWQNALERHQFAMRSRSKIGYHRARVALKKLRYTAEILLPALQEKWGKEPKELQKMLGEVHDLDVLWGKLKELRPAVSGESKASWKPAINRERKARLARYAAKTSRKNSAWQRWRAELPSGEKLDRAALAELAAWSRFRTPEFFHAQQIADLAAELFDSLEARGFAVGLPSSRARYIVQAAALLEDAGRADGDKAHHKNSYRMIRELPAPMGWSEQEWQLAAVVARYHRKALPQAKHKEFRELPASLQHATLFLSGILRLANALEGAPTKIRRLQVDATLDGLIIRAYGFDGEEPLLSKLANAKHLLEIACGRPVTVLPGTAGAGLRAVPAKTKKDTAAA